MHVVSLVDFDFGFKSMTNMAIKQTIKAYIGQFNFGCILYEELITFFAPFSTQPKNTFISTGCKTIVKLKYPHSALLFAKCIYFRHKANTFYRAFKTLIMRTPRTPHIKPHLCTTRCFV